ncbi:MAG: ABC transporter ATP-binding protein [Propionibacteriaceae bacterium]|jgi:energy-coupling factor transport system ATP-binding protein|nr:ABC transporter ATP-binding protein [Propionibacteriaceae bacterium]
MRDVRFSYGDGVAIDQLSLDIHDGEFAVFTGPSGCGKTTLTRLVNGLIPHYHEGELSGEVEVEGRVPAENALWKLPVGSVFQNPRAQFFTTDATSEIAFGPENLGLPKGEILRRVSEAVAAFDLDSLRSRSVFAMSGGEKQRLACASVAAVRPSIYALDEPSANLDAHSTGELREIMGAWKRSGATVVVAEHRLGYLRELADRVIMLDRGRITGELDAEQFQAMSDAELRALGLRSACGGEFTAARTMAAAEHYTVENLACRYWTHNKPVPVAGPDALRIDHLELPKGQISAVVGANGAGKTTFLNWLAGLRKGQSGALLDGTHAWSQKQRLTRVFLVLQDVNHQLFAESVSDEIDLSLQFAATGQAQHTRDEILSILDLADVADRHPLSLSAGQKQRVSIGVALASGRDVIVLDEPTSGLDLLHMEAVAKALRELAATGKTVIVATHDADLVQSCADNVIKLNGGELA